MQPQQQNKQQSAAAMVTRRLEEIFTKNGLNPPKPVDKRGFSVSMPNAHTKGQK